VRRASCPFADSSRYSPAEEFAGRMAAWVERRNRTRIIFAADPVEAVGVLERDQCENAVMRSRLPTASSGAHSRSTRSLYLCELGKVGIVWQAFRLQNPKQIQGVAGVIRPA
jgi:hypothetical protein